MSDLLEISIAPAFAAAGVAVRLGCLEAEVEVRPDDAEIGAALEQAAASRAAGLTGRPVGEIPAIAETRGAFRKLGKDPSRYRPSSEALLRRVAQGKGLFRVNNVVDVNNLISLESGLPAGTYDLDRLAPPFSLEVGQAGIDYRAIARGPLNIEHLPVLCDAGGPFGSPTSDSERSMITEATKRLLLVVYAFDTAPGLAPACTAAAEALARFCRGRVARHWTIESAP